MKGICMDEVRGPLTTDHLGIVNQLLRLAQPPIVISTRGDRELPNLLGVFAPPPSPIHCSIYDCDGQTNAGLDNQDDDVMALKALSGEKDRDAFCVVPWGDHARPSANGLGAGVESFVVDGPSRIPMTQNRALDRDIGRRPRQRELSRAPCDEIERWFEMSGIDPGRKCMTDGQLDKAKRLAYTWKDVFAFGLRDVRLTDLVTHSIELEPGSRPFRMRQPKYSQDEVAFAQRLHPAMEAAGFIVPGMSEWGAYTRYPPKKNGDHRFVCNYMPVNSCTVKPQWPTHSRDKVFDTLLQGDHDVFFQGDAANGYWGVGVTPGDEYKTAFISPNMQYFMLRMPQGMTGSGHTYCALGDMAFGEWPVPDRRGSSDVESMGEDKPYGPSLPRLMGYNAAWDTAFDVYIDDHNASAKGFDAMFNFLHLLYFPRLEFARISLTPSKTVMFGDRIHSLGFELLQGQVRPSEKHRKRFEHWSKPENHPKSAKELDEFLFLVPFLTRYIPGRASRVVILKTAYLTKVQKLTPKGKESKQTKWIPKAFDWGPEHAEAFSFMCEAVQATVATAPDRRLQFHLACDASDVGTGGVLFQLQSTPPGTEVSNELMPKMVILSFISDKLSDAETRYTIGEREALAVIRGLKEARPWIIESPMPTKVYTDHLNLISALTSPTVPTGRIAHWIDDLNIFDIEVIHRPNTAQIMGIADGMSRLVGPTVEPSEMHVGNRPSWTVEACLARPLIKNPGTGTLLPFGLLDKSRLLNPGVKTPVSYVDKSGWYGEIVGYLIGGNEMLEGLPAQVRRKVKRDAMHYVLTDGTLLRRESRNEFAICVLASEVPDVLRWSHDLHGHFATASTLHKLKGVFWWPTRYSDVEEYIRSCDPCASVSAARAVHASPMPVVALRPWDLVGTDFTGKISPPGLNGETHIHLVADYFSRFLFCQVTGEPTVAEVRRSWEPLVHVLGFPAELYSDNAKYFVSPDNRKYFEQGGTKILNAPVYAAWSVGLIERLVRLVKEGLKKWAHGRGYRDLEEWPLAVPNIVDAINGRLVRGMPYTPSDIMLGWPKRSSGSIGDDTSPPEADRSQLSMAFASSGATMGMIQVEFNERRECVRRRTSDHWIEKWVESIPHAENPFEVGCWVWERVPKTRDIKLRRFRAGNYDDSLENNRASAFKPRWTGPWEVDGLASAVSLWICDPVTRKRRRKVHVNSLKRYTERNERLRRRAEEDELEEVIYVGGENEGHDSPVNWGDGTDLRVC